MARNIRQHSKKYKAKAVNLAFSYGSVNQVAKELEVPGSTLREWLNKAKFAGKGVIESDGPIKAADVSRMLERK